MVFSNAKEKLRRYRQGNPDSWRGRCIGWLYEVYCEIQWRLRKKMMKEIDEIKARNLVLSVGYVSIAGVEGDIAEFGTMSGATACIIAEAMANFSGESNNKPKKLHLFDSFVGLPAIESPVDRENPHVVSGMWGYGLLMGVAPKRLIAKVHNAGLGKDRIKVYDGWFCNTLPRLPEDTKFAMLHIDCDLYQSTIDVLGACFSMGFIAKGAIILFDDWNLAGASPELGERRAWLEIVEKYSVVYSDEGGYSWSSHKFIVHSYKRRSG